MKFRLLVLCGLLASCNAPPPPRPKHQICISPSGEQFNAPAGAGDDISHGNPVVLTDRNGYKYPVNPGYFGQAQEGWRCKDTDLMVGEYR